VPPRAFWDERDLVLRETLEPTLGDLSLTLDATVAAQVQLSLRR
jgi:hypothetical protein